jgi:DDE_Tnp_1-associated
MSQVRLKPPMRPTVQVHSVRFRVASRLFVSSVAPAALRSFDELIGLLGEIPDPRRAEGKLYRLPYVLLFSILAVVTGGNSYRSIETFITVHRRRLNAAFGLRWKRAGPYRHSPHPPAS